MYNSRTNTMKRGKKQQVFEDIARRIKAEEWPSGSINWDIYDAIGWDKVVFQTCLGDSAIWISYGVPVHPTPEFLAAHQ